MRHLYDRLNRIATPREGMAGCSTQAKYAVRHEAEMAAKRKAFPALDIMAPTVVLRPMVPFVAGGKWIVLCDCGDAPMAAPEWTEVRCFNCGAIYTNVLWPEERIQIEALLVARPSALVRTWLPEESAADLLEQNRAHGVPDVRLA